MGFGKRTSKKIRFRTKRIKNDQGQWIDHDVAVEVKNVHMQITDMKAP